MDTLESQAKPLHYYTNVLESVMVIAPVRFFQIDPRGGHPHSQGPRQQPSEAPLTSLPSPSLTFTQLHTYDPGRTRKLGMPTRRMNKTKRCGRRGTIAAVWASVAVAANGQNLTDAQVGIVVQRLAEGAKASWELGTRAQALIELNAPSYSVLSHSTPLPPSQNIPSNLTSGLSPVFNITHSIVTALNSSSGPRPLIEDGSAADPASIGFAVLLANWTKQDQGKVDYQGAAKDELDFLYQKVPRTSDGALSHRVNQVQLWSDFVYMVPPFLAYYGVTARNRTLLEEAYNQISLYRKYLRDPNTKGLWKHVQLGTGTDDGHWSTGNGWAAAGMLRVLGTISNSEYGNTMKNEQKDLAKWIKEIHTGMYSTLDQDELLFTNYPDQPASAPKNFYDAASTALMASTVYRFSLIWGEHHYLPLAEKTRLLLSSNSNSGNDNQNNMSNMKHFDSNGWLTPVVNPHSYGEQGAQSPEAQAFVVEMHAAWRDWVEDGSKGANGCGRVVGTMDMWLALVVVVGTIVGSGMW